MNSSLNPYAPGAGTPPPELAGRDVLRENIRVALERVRSGRSAKSALMVGLRGTGKTVLLNQLRIDAGAAGIQTLRFEAPENRSLPSILCPELRIALLKLSRDAQAAELARRALRALAGFVTSLKAKFGDIEVGLDFDPEPGLADNGSLEHDLQALLEAAARAAKKAGTAIAIFIDELQYIEEKQLEPLITALHLASQQSLPIILVGAGLPNLPGRMGKAKSYAERMFDFPNIGPLPEAEARKALVKPAAAEGVTFEEAALRKIITLTKGYPYFLQEWGKHAWDAAQAPLITLRDVKTATQTAIAALDENFFRVRFDRLTPLEKRYLRALAEIGPGPFRSGDAVEHLGRSVSTLAPTRAQLIAKGMLWSPRHGDMAFTVPMFDQFMRRAMPLETPGK